ncbi:hypothetical protein GO986_05855 [Deinococcus sp. HMF7620]|uniref:Uncharacterized protein n=1 Tax=Deinococcus arboris TaxID=2682977 RepID=A0A7C9M5A0_9DEIO|nr:MULTISPECIES: hypothetical protein [Deinococcus]MBZ9749392.1 hypothetical protein [Deinococcus betulae]MVN86285.1 hypothetical protein [Deinococcus arboris]
MEPPSSGSLTAPGDDRQGAAFLLGTPPLVTDALTPERRQAGSMCLADDPDATTERVLT